MTGCSPVGHGYGNVAAFAVAAVVPVVIPALPTQMPLLGLLAAYFVVVVAAQLVGGETVLNDALAEFAGDADGVDVGAFVLVFEAVAGATVVDDGVVTEAGAADD